MHAGYEEEEEAELETSRARDDQEDHYGRDGAAMHRCLLLSEIRTHCLWFVVVQVQYPFIVSLKYAFQSASKLYMVRISRK